MNKTHNTILVIDDNDINRKYIKSVLSDSRHQPILTSGGHEALAYLKNHQVDLILVDIQMPEMDGFECYRRIRELGYKGYILAITAFSSNSEKAAMIEYGFDDFIIKPVKPSELLEIINYWSRNIHPLEKGSFSIEGEHLDHSVLDELLKYTDKDSLMSLIDEFVDETKIGLESILKLNGANRYTEILSILHTIKGNAGTFGFNKLSSFASQLEINITEGKLDKVETEINHFLEYATLLLRDHKRLFKTN